MENITINEEELSSIKSSITSFATKKYEEGYNLGLEDMRNCIVAINSDDKLKEYVFNKSSRGISSCLNDNWIANFSASDLMSLVQSYREKMIGK